MGCASLIGFSLSSFLGTRAGHMELSKGIRVRRGAGPQGRHTREQPTAVRGEPGESQARGSKKKPQTNVPKHGGFSHLSGGTH